MLSKEYLLGRVSSAVTESEKTQAEQNLLLYCILEKLNKMSPEATEEVKTIAKNRDSKKSGKPIEGRE